MPNATQREADTICAIATAQGGALGIVRISGPQAIGITQAIFSRSLAQAPGHSLLLGNVVDGNDILDQALLSLFRKPNSFTGEDTCELTLHASPYIMRRTIELLIAQGARQARPGEYTQRAFLNGKLDLSQAEAVADLISSQSQAAHRIAMSQLRGSCRRHINLLREKLLNLTTLLELELDFAEEDLTFAPRHELLTLAHDIDQHITQLTQSFRHGEATKNGIRVSIVGAPNVGKSTLLNALLGEERAIVSPLEGTTRDTIEETLTIDGRLFRFTDTAGLRHTSDPIEQQGIKRARQSAQEAHIIVALAEPGVPFPALDERPEQRIIRRTNKTPEFSALHRVGLNELRRELIRCAPSPTEADATLTNLRHYEALLAAQQALSQATQALRDGRPADLVAEDLRECLAHMGQITGEVTPQEVLNTVFSRFCIGK